MDNVDTEGQDTLAAIEHWASSFSPSILQVIRTPATIKIVPVEKKAASMEFILEMGNLFTVCLGRDSIELTLPTAMALALCEAVSKGRLHLTIFHKNGEQIRVDAEITLCDGEKIEYRRQLGFARLDSSTRTDEIQFAPYENAEEDSKWTCT